MGNQTSLSRLESTILNHYITFAYTGMSHMMCSAAQNSLHSRKALEMLNFDISFCYLGGGGWRGRVVAPNKTPTPCWTSLGSVYTFWIFMVEPTFLNVFLWDLLPSREV